VSSSPEWRTAAFTLAGAVLIAVGILVSAGWPYVLGGIVLLGAAVGSR
jgi:hypothetical protein